MKLQSLQTSIIATPGAPAPFIFYAPPLDTFLAFMGIGIETRFAMVLKRPAPRLPIAVCIGKFHPASHAMRDGLLRRYQVARVVPAKRRTFETKVTIANVARFSIYRDPGWKLLPAFVTDKHANLVSK